MWKKLLLKQRFQAPAIVCLEQEVIPQLSGRYGQIGTPGHGGVLYKRRDEKLAYTLGFFAHTLIGFYLKNETGSFTFVYFNAECSKMSQYHFHI